ncbi:MAG: leucine-rich repeat domain-containing protein [Bacteroidota bacterium]|nr:leucine-rich repeat domain-containing protein [Bacteroidota bacterium]
MRNKFISFFCIFLLAAVPLFAQKKNPHRNVSHPASRIQIQRTPSVDKQPSTVKQPEQKSIITFTPEQTEEFRQQAGQLVRFFQGTLNFLADKGNAVKEKEVIINQSYLKYFRDSKVQVEDDLDEHRLVPLYKDIPAYLTDVDFFFKKAHFEYTIQTVDVMTNSEGQTYFKVTANRNLSGITINDDSVNSNKVRYFEINYDDSKKELKIVSIYTTKLNEKEDIKNWWNGLTAAWQDLLGKDQTINGDITLAQVNNFQDSIATINGQKVSIDPARIYGLLFQLVNRTEIDISNNPLVTTLDPLGKLSSLKSVNAANTPVVDLMPLRNLNKLESLDISGTKVTSLEPLRYANHIRELKMKNTTITDISLLGGFSNMEVLDISSVKVNSLDPLKELTALKDFRCAETQISDLTPLSGMTDMELLDFSETQISNLEPLKSLSKLRILIFNHTNVSSLSALEQIPSIQKIYCDHSGVTLPKALDYMKIHPDVTVIFESEELTKWWNGLSGEWKKIFSAYSRLDATPTQEQLHRLITVDSISITGRVSLASLDPVKELSQLRSIDLASTSVNDLTPLADLMELRHINASNSAVLSLDPLKNLKNLEWLNIENTKVKDLSTLAGITNLQLIYADNTRVSIDDANALLDQTPNVLVIFQTRENNDWWDNLSQEWKKDIEKISGITGKPGKEQLQKIANLENLIIREDPDIVDLQPVVRFSRLRELECSDTRITDLSPVTRLPRLRTLKVSRNPVSDLSSLSGMTGLKELDVSNTQVESLEAIQNLTGLETLKFSGTPVRNLKYLQKMTNLSTLEFYNTKISNLDVLESMNNLKSLKIFNTKISARKVDNFKTAHPGCEVVYY